MAHAKIIKNENRDPITGEPGAHPVGTGIGTALGAAAGAASAAAIGAAYGTVAGPVGMAAGAAIGGIVGGLAGSEVAEDINPTAEEAYWEETYRTRPYIERDVTFDTYRPAYRHGVASYTKYQGRAFDEVEPQLSKDWQTTSPSPSLSWDKAKPATRDAYDRLAKRDQATRKPAA